MVIKCCGRDKEGVTLTLPPRLPSLSSMSWIPMLRLLFRSSKQTSKLWALVKLWDGSVRVVYSVHTKQCGRGGRGMKRLPRTTSTCTRRSESAAATALWPYTTWKL